MAKRRNIRVNELDRYVKSSAQLVLEEYSSCEVPAGCGGAIMRWIDPHAALPLHVWCYTTGKSELFFDGSCVASSRIEVRSGKHVLALSLRPEADRQPVLALALRYGDVDTLYCEPKRSRAIGHKIEILSGNTSLLGTTREPHDSAWQHVDFDARLWVPLTREAVKEVKPERDWHLDQVEKAGAQRVALPKAKGPIWVRCAFQVDLGGDP